MNDNESLDSAPPRAHAATWLRRLGPGLITGAADDDPSGIGTYSQAGAQFGFELLWSLLLTYPLMTAIQLVSARIGRVTGKGLASNMRAHYPAWLLYVTVVLLIVANVINIAADLSAMGAAVNLLLHGPQQLYVVCLGGISAVLQIFVPYERYARLLKWTALVLLAYVAVALVVPVDWADVGRALVLPHVQLSAGYLTTVVAVLGTTISPYLFFWQASQEVEELHAAPNQRPLRRMPHQAPAQLRRINFDTWVGMGVSNVIAFFITLTAAATLNRHHIDVKTSADAARALEPIAGHFAYMLFALGIIGTGLLALPVLAGSAAYAAAGTFRWRNSLALRIGVAPEFYAVIALAIVGGVAITFMHFDPIRALYWSAVINGLAAVPIMIVMMLMAGSTRIMGEFAVKGMLAWGGWVATAAMAIAAIGVFVPG
ncbi:Nramp family divalent metal transporter [Burkholderia sp. AU19243]|uniref:Iron transporter n=1 Tax=Burkholderia latens TaxID=488446 RepID=A0AAP1G901_9BURK|nr:MULTISPECIES: Nramp family divalent metal transporter [Burkholderia]AIO39363.1 natural resistance-associated macrophage family protein [Burkholderia cenocepacia]MBR8144502.1 Nramp family divalent metal transporter [Burkholderia vietnamiensis]AOK07864.1 iron transporter [Burkholderia latens]KVA04869.1 iron transporter [Burkholderia latens]MBR8362428.1 Nramp family divalent metal transporter [Burkholderia sp. AU19243]